MFLRLLFCLSACSACEREQMGCQNDGTCQIVERDGQERKKCRCPSAITWRSGAPYAVITGEKCDRIEKRT